jgi:hypothetical protein
LGGAFKEMIVDLLRYFDAIITFLLLLVEGQVRLNQQEEAEVEFFRFRDNSDGAGAMEFLSGEEFHSCSGDFDDFTEFIVVVFTFDCEIHLVAIEGVFKIVVVNGVLVGIVDVVGEVSECWLLDNGLVEDVVLIEMFFTYYSRT